MYLLRTHVHTDLTSIGALATRDQLPTLSADEMRCVHWGQKRYVSGGHVKDARRGGCATVGVGGQRPNQG